MTEDISTSDSGSTSTEPSSEGGSVSMTETQRRQANKETIRELLRLQKDITERTENQTMRARVKADKTYNDLRYMIWAAFLLGLSLIVISVGFFIFTERTLEVLGLSALGVADWLALFLYKPMDRLQKANADYAQQLTIMKGWATVVNLQLLAMDITRPETVISAASDIQDASIEIAKAFQRFIE